jgi:hypothetical protein
MKQRTPVVMIPGFTKIVEERIRKAQKKGEFENLEGAGERLNLADDQAVGEELRLAYKILKNADCLPPEIEIKKEIHQTEELLAGMTDTAEKYRTMKKLNFLQIDYKARIIRFKVQEEKIISNDWILFFFY